MGLSLWGNQLESLEAVVEMLSGLSQLRALWLNNTPVNTHKFVSYLYIDQLCHFALVGYSCFEVPRLYFDHLELCEN